MESGFISEKNNEPGDGWIPVEHNDSSRFEFFKVRHFGALHFVKRPSPAYRQDLVTAESLKKEFYIGYNLNHPLIVRYMRMEGDAVYEEYIDGLSLREMIDSEDERLSSPAFIEHICRQLLEATAYLHSHGVIHNDIKPENVMISRIGDQLKLVDLGCATADMWDATEGYTPAYKAPEQGVDDTNIYTDIFLVGKLMEELAHAAGVSRRWKKFISKAIADDIDDRFSSDGEALAAVPDLKRKKKMMVTSVAAFMIFLLSCGLYFYSKDRQKVSEDSVLAEGPTSITDSVQSEAYDKVVEFEPQKVESESVSEERPKSARAVIDDDLEKYVSHKYNKDVFPQCRKYGEMPDNDDKMILRQQIFDNMQSAIDDVTAYAENLAVKYPAEGDYARRHAYSLLNEFQTKAGLLQYPNSANNQSSEDNVTLSPDSLQ